MTKTTLLVTVLTICLVTNSGYCRDDSLLTDTEPEQTEHNEASDINED
jgi:hypothetical protein